MQEVDFYKLSRGVQDRFIASADGAGEPRAWLEARAPWARTAWLWIAAATGCVLLALLVARLGFGRLLNDFGRQPPAFVALYTLAIGGAFACTLQALVVWRRRSALPFRARTYLFPIGVIDATSRMLQSHAIDAHTQCEVTEHVLQIRFGSPPAQKVFSFPVHDARVAADVDAKVRASRERVVSTSADRNSMGALDPLVDIGVVNPFAPTTAHASAHPAWLSYRHLWAAVAGVLLGGGVWALRNAASDRAMLRDAERQGTAEAYRAYLDRGGRNELVGRVLLPRAELAEVVRKGGIEPIERFAAAHPASPIQSEVDSALRQAMLRDLDAARAPGTVAALREFAKAHQSERIADELARAIHALYQTALQRYRTEAPSDGQAYAFVERLFAYLEAHGPSTEIRFRRKASKTMAAADASVKKSSFFMGAASLPSQYFDEHRARARERLVAQAIEDRFAASFASDLLTLKLGAPLDEGEGAPARLPTMFIEHVAEVSGASYLSNNPRGVFVGLGLVFDVTFRIPGDNKPQKFRLSAWRPPDLRAPRKEDTFEASVYEAMASNGYGQFTDRYLATFFARQPTRAQN